MKVLILGNTAGVMYPMVKWLNENGHESKLVTRHEQDKLYQVIGKDGVIGVDTPMDFFKTSLKLIRKFKPDLIHLNSVAKLLPLVRLVALRTPIVYAKHGPGKQNYIGSYDVAYMLSNYVQKSTPDIKGTGVWLDRLINDMFYDRGGRKSDTALMLYNDYFYVDHREAGKKWAEACGIELTILDRTKGQTVLHERMPEFLSKFEYFLDWKGIPDGENGEMSLTVTGLEAVSCGCKLIHDSDFNKILENIKITIPKDYLEVYKSLKKARWSIAIRMLPSVFKGLFLMVKQELTEKWKK